MGFPFLSHPGRRLPAYPLDVNRCAALGLSVTPLPSTCYVAAAEGTVPGPVPEGREEAASTSRNRRLNGSRFSNSKCWNSDLRTSHSDLLICL